MNKTKCAVLAAALVLALILGLSGVGLASDADAEAAGRDRLIGIFVSREHLDLFDMEAYLNDNAFSIMGGGALGDTSDYEGRIYAKLQGEDGREEYVFPGLEGSSAFSARMSGADGVGYSSSSGNGNIAMRLHLAYTDEGEELSLEGTLYVLTGAGTAAFYFNPVYQSADGRVYLTAGSGMSCGGESSGQSMTHTLSDEVTQRVNGETETYKTTVELTVEFIDPIKSVTLIEFDSKGTPLRREEHAPDAMPETLETSPDAEYLVKETLCLTQEGERVEREIYDRGAESLESFIPRDDRICVPHTTNIIWK